MNEVIGTHSQTGSLASSTAARNLFPALIQCREVPICALRASTVNSNSQHDQHISEARALLSALAA